MCYGEFLTSKCDCEVFYLTPFLGHLSDLFYAECSYWLWMLMTHRELLMCAAVVVTIPLKLSIHPSLTGRCYLRCIKLPQPCKLVEGFMHSMPLVTCRGGRGATTRSPQLDSSTHYI